MLKTCSNPKCPERNPQPSKNFYKHHSTKDKLMGKCKTCVKAQVSGNRLKNIDRVREYDRMRGKLPHRIQKNSQIKARIRLEHPEINAARVKVQKALKNGTLIKPKRCSWDNKVYPSYQIEAHHQDYSRPLDVTWLCAKNHKILHFGKTREAVRMRSVIKVP